MAEFQYEGQYARADLDGDTVVIRCDKRTANYLALRLTGTRLPVLRALLSRLDHLIVGNSASRAQEHQHTQRGIV